MKKENKSVKPVSGINLVKFDLNDYRWLSLSILIVLGFAAVVFFHPLDSRPNPLIVSPTPAAGYNATPQVIANVTLVPTAVPTTSPSVSPAATATATAQPSSVPTLIPTATPTVAPTSTPTATPKPTATPLPTPTKKLNSVYTANVSLKAVVLPVTLFPGDSRKVFEYSGGSLYLPENLVSAGYAADGYYYYLLQFTDEPYKPRMDQLELIGAKFSWPVNENAFIIYANAPVYSAVRGMRDVNFTTQYISGFKIAEPLFYSEGTVRVKVLFFRGENEKSAIDAISTNFTGTIESTAPMQMLADAPDGEGYAIVSINASRLPDVANLTAVHWIQPA